MNNRPRKGRKEGQGLAMLVKWLGFGKLAKPATLHQARVFSIPEVNKW